MIRLTCPKCLTVIQAESPAPGQPLVCPGCKSRLHVQASGVMKKTAPVPVQTAPEEPEYRPLRPRRKKSDNLPMIIGLSVGGGGLVIALLVVVIVLVLSNSGGKPAAIAKNNPSPRKAVEAPEPPPETKPAPPRETARPKENTPPVSRTPEPENKPPILASDPGPSTNNPPTRPVKPTEQPVSPVSPSAPATNGNVGAGSDVYNYVLKSVVFILVRLDEGFASGSGALIDKENRVIITNDHVVDGATDMAFFFPTYKDGKLVMSRTAFVEQMRKGKEEDIIKGKVLVADVKRDLALVQLERLPEGVEALPLAREQAVTGQIGHSVGNPGGSGALWVYTSGTVRALYHHRWANRGVDRKPVMRDCDIVETQSPTNPGDSGGPLVNERGELIGVTHGAHPTANLLSMFIDVTEARALVNETFRKENLTWRPAKRPLLAKRGSVGGGDVTSLIKDLESQDARTRARAAKGLGDLGPEAQLAIPGLLKAIKDNDALTRRAASDALAKIGPAAKADLPALAGALKDNNLEVQRYAAGAVGELGGDAESAVPELLELATSGDALLKQIVLRALGKTGGGARDKVIPVLSEALKDSQKDVRVAAAEGLTSLSTGQSSDLPIFTALLKNQQDVEIRIQGARGLAKLGREAKPALGDLIAAAKDSDKKVRKAVIEALGPFGPEARNALPIFSEALKDNDKELRRAGLQALAKMGAESKNSIPAIRDLLKDPELRKEALATLGKLGPVAKDAVPAMAELLKDPDKDLKLETMAVLAALGPDAAKAVPNLIVLFEDREITFRRRVAETLAKIGRPAITPLVTALADNDLYIRWGACDTLAEMGPAARTSAVINALSYVGGNDRYLEVRDAAKKAYAKVTAK